MEDALLQSGLKDAYTPPNYNELFAISFADTRRIAALRAKERVKYLIKKQAVWIPKGKLALNATQPYSLLPTVNESKIGIVLNSWVHFLKFTDVHGVRFLIHYLKTYPKHAQFHQAILPYANPPGFQNLRFNPHAIKYGSSLVMQVTIILANVRNNAALATLINDKFGQLLRAGYTKDALKEGSDAFLSYLKDNIPGQWNDKLESSWKTIITHVLELGIKSWEIGDAMKNTHTKKFKAKSQRE